MHKFYRSAALFLSVLLSLQLIACSLKPSASGSDETSNAANIFESAVSNNAGTSASKETTSSTESSETQATTMPSESTTETTAAKELTPTPAEATATPIPTEPAGSSASSETEPSLTDPSTSGTVPVPKDLLAVYESEPQDKKNYIIYNNAAGCTITSKVSGTGFEGTAIPSTDIYLTGNLPADALEFTIFYDERMNFTLRDLKGNFLVMNADGSLFLTDKPVEDRYQFWRMEKTDGGWNIINTGDSKKLALYYSNGVFSTKPCYNNSGFVFNFYEVG